MGVILEVRFRCVPKYDVAETMVECASLEEVLAGEAEYPLQQFYLAPHLWRYFAQRRRATEYREARRLSAKCYRAWWFFSIDIALHFTLKTLNAIGPWAIRFFYRHILSKTIIKNVTFVDHADLMLTMEHELFKHLEIEIFVPAKHLAGAARFVRYVVETFDGATEPDDADVAALLEGIGLAAELARYRGTFTQHYPITFRRVLADDALIAMSSDPASHGVNPRGAPDWYAISFITYVEPREPFYAMASFLARAMTRLFYARLHWGKYFPLACADIESAYPRLAEFRALCAQVDPNRVFRNAFTDRVLFSEPRS
jgi:hypothetical protein